MGRAPLYLFFTWLHADTCSGQSVTQVAVLTETITPSHMFIALLGTDMWKACRHSQSALFAARLAEFGDPARCAAYDSRQQIAYS